MVGGFPPLLVNLGGVSAIDSLLQHNKRWPRSIFPAPGLWTSDSDSDTEREKERDFRSERNRSTQRNEQSSKSVSQEKREAKCSEKCCFERRLHMLFRLEVLSLSKLFRSCAVLQVGVCIDATSNQHKRIGMLTNAINVTSPRRRSIVKLIVASVHV